MSQQTDQVLKAIRNHWREFTVPPTIRNIQTATGITSTSTIHYHMLKLEAAGWIKRIRSKPVPVKLIQLIKESYHEESTC